ncbi:MAG: hypothetical protein ACPGO5_02430 [Patescibacteria group bacterium]
MDYKKQQDRRLRHILSTPFIWVNIVPIILADIVIELYHRICFPLYGLEYISRKKYIAIDRHKLEYLGWFDKMNCVYCGYVNGWFRYGAKIANVTEQYWCAIKHSSREGYFPEQYQDEFMEYGDEMTFRELTK